MPAHCVWRRGAGYKKCLMIQFLPFLCAENEVIVLRSIFYACRSVLHNYCKLTVTVQERKQQLKEYNVLGYIVTIYKVALGEKARRTHKCSVRRVLNRG
jgi:hypothetical protein